MVCAHEEEILSTMNSICEIMEIISRKEAKSRGLEFYFTAKKCKYGHFSERKVVNKNCIECIKITATSSEEKQRKNNYYERNKIRINKRDRDAHRNDPRKLLLKEAKKRARNNNLEFDIELDDIKIPKICPLSGLKIEVGNGKLHASSPTLDRINNKKGYTKENILVLSHIGNTTKGALSLKQLGDIGLRAIELDKTLNKGL